MNATEEKEKTAYHEAGHCCAHHFFQHPVESIEIRQNEGQCVLPREWEEEFDRKRLMGVMQRESWSQYIVCLLAGRAAVAHWHGSKPQSDEAWPTSSDYKDAHKYALDLNDGDSKGATLLLKWLERKAELLVEVEWSRISCLAAALLEHNKIEGNDKIQHFINGNGRLETQKAPEWRC
jgi:hypothetical protein